MSVESFFFQSHDFIFRNTTREIISFLEEKNNEIHFTQIEQRLVSGDRSPFGGFIIRQAANKDSIKALVEKVLLYAMGHSIESVEIKCYPEIYAPQMAGLINDVLGESDFHLKYRDITQILYIDKDLNLDADRKRRIKGCIALEFKFMELGIESLPKAYDLFLQSRQKKGYPVTMKLADFFNEFRKFPLRYKLYGVLDRDQLIAASVVVFTNDKIIYYFFSGDDLGYRKYSPITYLVYKLHRFAEKEGFRFIDLGISTDKGIMNQGLYNFKKSFGAVDSYKLTFEKKL